MRLWPVRNFSLEIETHFFEQEGYPNPLKGPNLFGLGTLELKLNGLRPIRTTKNRVHVFPRYDTLPFYATEITMRGGRALKKDFQHYDHCRFAYTIPVTVSKVFFASLKLLPY
jgi:hypothetical protein